jgi:predicted dehydrogenase
MAIKVAIIGLGIMGRRMLEHMDRHAAFQPIAVWDPDPAACAAAIQMAPDTRLASSADDALGDADMVYLACPPRPRKQTALTASRRGKGRIP